MAYVIDKIEKIIAPTLKKVRQDFFNAIEPYQDEWQGILDLGQPLDGAKNLFLSVMHLLAILIMIVLSPFAGLFALFILIKNSVYDSESWNAKSEIRSLEEYVLDYLEYFLLETPVSMITHALRGLSQIVTTPLTWFIKVPVRIGITLYNWYMLPEPPKGGNNNNTPTSTNNADIHRGVGNQPGNNLKQGPGRGNTAYPSGATTGQQQHTNTSGRGRGRGRGGRGSALNPNSSSGQQPSPTSRKF